MNDFIPETEISLDVARAIAQGMMKLSAVDGVHERETEMIEAFLAECYAQVGGKESYEELLAQPFDIQKAKEVLNTGDLRELFLKTCLLLAFADGVYSAPEQSTMDYYAIELGIPAGRLRELELQVKEHLLGQFAGVKVFRDKVEELGRKLGLSPEAIERALQSQRETTIA